MRRSSEYAENGGGGDENHLKSHHARAEILDVSTVKNDNVVAMLLQAVAQCEVEVYELTTWFSWVVGQRTEKKTTGRFAFRKRCPDTCPSRDFHEERPRLGTRRRFSKCRKVTDE